MPRSIPEIVSLPSIEPVEKNPKLPKNPLLPDKPPDRRAGPPPSVPARRPTRRTRINPIPEIPLATPTTATETATHASASKKAGYVPMVPSPLKIDGNGSDPSDGSDTTVAGGRRVYPPPTKPRVATRRNLQIRVVDPPLVSDEDLISPVGSVFGSSKLKRPSPVMSLISVGRDFSRYPSRQQSMSLLELATPTAPPSPLGYPVEQLGHGFNPSDPERGYSPYLERRSPPIRYPSLDEKEDDDSLHNPDGKETTPSIWECCTNCNWRCFCTIMGLMLLVSGPTALFVVWPIVTYSYLNRSDTPPADPELSSHKYPLLGAVRSSLIDPDTPKYALTRDSVLGQGKLKLVFSDEFNVDGRTFYENEDQFWQAADFHYASTNDLEWYDPDAITTGNGSLQIRMEAMRNHDLDYRSGMLQSWNKLCFKGGVLEVSASLAGPAGVPGLWPGIWTLGNLARPGFLATTDGVWPYSYDECDAGITPNQSSFDGISFLPGQKFASCVCKGEEHPSPGKGRGAPEIDALEGAAEYNMRVGVATQSNQVAPFDIWYQVDPNFLAIRDTEITQLNGWSGGPFQQAISGVTMLNNDWYDGKLFQKYAFEYIPGAHDSAIAWFVGDEETFRMTGDAIGPNGNIGQRHISQEPMSIILNLGISTSWTWIDWEKLKPSLAEGTTMYVDYVRIYQKEGEESITCDPPGYETTKYIKEHPKAYQNANMTRWANTGYPWPKNKLINDCE